MITARGGLAIAALFVSALWACAARPIVAGEPKVVTKLEIAPFAAHEECTDLAPGDRLDYRFQSTEPLAFNIHYHDAKLIVMPITRENVVSDAGIFTPTIAQGYCLMWEAGAAGASIDYRVLVRRVVR
jgi:hypothetical protein